MLSNSEVPKRILFFGDSLTQYATLPQGYITLLNSSLERENRSENFSLIAAGIGGDKIYDLYLRLEDDVLNKHPDKVVIMIGINDIWHKTSGIGTDSVKFKRFYEAIIHKLQANNIQIVLVTPTLIGEYQNLLNQQDHDMELYSEIIRELAATHACELIDLRKVFIDYIQKHNTNNAEFGVLTYDKVHLNNTGNQLIHDAFSGFL
jgi:lysophospholipase L1-like esterase